LQDAELGIGRRQIGLQNAALRLEQPWQMRVAVERNAVGRQFEHALKRAVEADDVLFGQAVDQIHADRAEAGGAGGVHHQPGFLETLLAVDGDLHVLGEILHADAHAVEAEIGEQFHGVEIDLARVDLDRIFPIGGKLEMLARRGDETAQFVMRKESRRATAQMQLRDLPRPAECRHMQANFAVDVIEILRRLAVILGDDLVTGAVIANRAAKGDVKV